MRDEVRVGHGRPCWLRWWQTPSSCRIDVIEPPARGITVPGVAEVFSRNPVAYVEEHPLDMSVSGPPVLATAVADT